MGDADASAGAGPAVQPGAKPAPHRIVVVGGGAGGLELATRLGDRLGRKGKVRVTLIEQARTHVWKPQLHEIAAGSMDVGAYQIDYLAQSHWHHFDFVIGAMTGLDRDRREVHVGAFVDDDEGVTPARTVAYDTLILAIGSLTNDFGTPGVKEFAIPLETTAEAERFHRRLVNAFMRADAQAEPLRPEQLKVLIVGAGATGVELAAELHRTTRTLISYGLERIDPKHLQLVVVEAADRILPALPERLATSARHLLERLDITVKTSARVAEVLHQGARLASGEVISAELVVWAAGVKAPDMLAGIAGLETNRINQLVVLPSLQTTRDPNVFAIGDCAACPWLGKEGKTVPPRAQSAHQMATHMLGQIERRLAGRPLVPYRYRDFGSLVSLGEYSTVGNLMGGLVGGNLWIEGHFARIMYLSLYKLHELALHGWWKVALDTLARLITRRTEPRVKLH